MNRHHTLIIATVAMAFVIPVGLERPAAADPDEAPVYLDPWQPRLAQTDGPRLERKRKKIIQRIRSLRAWKLTEALDLDEATAAKLFPVLNRYDERFAELARENRELRGKARQLMKSGKAAEIDRIVDRMVAQQRKLWELQERRFRDLRRVLSPAQAAKIFVVLPEIDRRLHRQLRRARRGAKAGQKGQGRPRKRGRIKNPFDVLK